MKGTRSRPKCIYTRQLMEIFDSIKIKYETFDVLCDEELRIAFKTYSDWPTYPQVYQNGELIGGYETIKDLYDNSEIEFTL
ncbi:glutaredoxin 3-like [Leptopilina boulardi]|uniref:glutaredoxin 3-like n=1 Tax=Leptopilina boulardi TaxID=63433 RepID=UPI0021F648B6|nr:glutaredoxin 3-like [Leptopilina boulardi]